MKTAVKLRNLQISKTLNTDANRIFPIPFKVNTVKKIKFSIPQESADLVKFTEEILNGNLHFLCGVSSYY